MGKSYWLKDEDQKGNFTNDKKDTFDPKKRYIGVRLQQGVPLLDRDWNELEDIRRYEEMITRREYIGNGSPDDGFKISACNLSANDFIIGTGHCMVDGFEVVNDPELYGNYVSSYLDQKRIYKTVPDLEPSSGKREDIVYLDVWTEEVRSQGNYDLLNNPQDLNEETTVRHKLVWRVMVDEGSNEAYKIKFVDYKYADGNWGTYPVVYFLKKGTEVEEEERSTTDDPTDANILQVDPLNLENRYVPLKPADARKLAKLIVDSNIEYTLKAGEKLELGQGYALKVKQIDVANKNVHIEFTECGKYIADQIISVIGGSNNTWELKLDGIQETNNVTVMKVHVKEIFQIGIENTANIDGLWLIDYANAIIIKPEDFKYIYALGSHHYYNIAKITRESGQNEILDKHIEDLREALGKKIFDIISTKSLTFKNDQIQPKEWPKLTCEAANQVNLSGDLIIKDSGKVGIGTINPADKLNIDPQGKGGILIGNPDWKNGGYTSLMMGISKEKEGYAWIRSIKSSGKEPGDICFNPEYPSYGNVGIGTDKPRARLHVEAADKPTIMAQSEYGGLVSGSNGGHGVFGTNMYIDSNNQLKTAGTHGNNYGYAGMHATWGNIHFYAADGNTIEKGNISPSSHMFIRGSDGNVGIGTTSPSAKLEVDGDIKVSGKINQKNLEDLVLPRGSIIMWNGNSQEIPQGWAICDGNNGTPDLRGRFIVGYNPNDSDYNSIGKTGGEKTHKLTIDEMPNHDHKLEGDGQHVHNFSYDWFGGIFPPHKLEKVIGKTDGIRESKQGATDSSTHSHKIDKKGGDKAHENRPPFYVLAFIMKII